MKKNRLLKFFKKIHKWPAIVIAFFAILYALSGIVMNHRELFSTVDISRKLLPANYTWQNWNLAALRGSTKISENEYLIFGNIGIWKTDSTLSQFTNFNQGFPKGIDNRKIYSLKKLGNTLFAGTHQGLFMRITEGEWQKVNLPVRQSRIADLGFKGDTLLVLTRHFLLKTTGKNDFITVQLPPPVGYERKTGLFDTLWQLHSGELFGLPGMLIVDLLGLVTVFLSISGLLHFFFPRLIKRWKRKGKPVKSLVNSTKINLRWHNVIGYVFVLFLIINTISGIHLRPPLLIPIANSKVGIIPGTNLDNPNPWFDKLRRVFWDEEQKRYLFSTSEGFYFTGESLTMSLQSFHSQPVVSLMGCNVFEPVGKQNFIVGSFNGMFVWNTGTGQVFDYFSGKSYIKPMGMSRPVAENMVAGMVEIGNNSFWFDYNQGAQTLAGKPFPEMNDEIRRKSKMALWNFAQEIHTGRIFEHLIGMFYLLIVPIGGICLLLVLISGFWLWWKIFKNKP